MILTTRDRAVKAILDYYPGGLPSNFLGAILHSGKYPQGFQKRLARLRDIGELHLLDIQRLDQNGQSGYRQRKNLVYQNGRQRKYKDNSHSLMEGLIEASFQIAAPQCGLQFIPWTQIQYLPETPYSTASSKAPFQLVANWDGQDHVFYPDGHPFKLAGPNGAYSFLFEADRDSQPNRALKDPQRPYIEAKLRNYLAFAQSEGHKKHFGFKSLFVLFITTSETKCRNFEQLLLEITNGKGAATILFKPFPDFLNMDGPMQPDISFMADPWPRAGHEPINLVERLGGKRVKL
jgi:hypothetical protein